jgi:MFS family permease
MGDEGSKNKPSSELGMRNVTNLGIVSLFTDISTEMILGVLPYFVVVELGATKALLGLMEGASDFLNYLFRVFSGVVSDRLGRRKPLVLLGYGLATFAKPLFAVATSWTDALVVRMTDRVGKGVRTSPRDALISESVKESKGGRAFGLHRSIDQLGAVVGPALAFLLLPVTGTRGLFWMSFIPGVLALIVLLFFVRDRKTRSAPANVFKNASTILTRRFGLFLIVMGIFALGAYNFSFILVKAGTLGVEERILPLVYAALNIATVVTALPSGLLADRFGKEKILAVGFGVFFAASAAGLATTEGALLAFPIAFIYGSYLGISETLQRALVPSFVSNELKGTGYAVYYLVIGACSLVANVVFGVLWDQFSMSAAFTYSLVMSSVGIVSMIAFILAKPRI